MHLICNRTNKQIVVIKTGLQNLTPRFYKKLPILKEMFDIKNMQGELKVLINAVTFLMEKERNVTQDTFLGNKSTIFSIIISFPIFPKRDLWG